MAESVERSHDLYREAPLSKTLTKLRRQPGRRGWRCGHCGGRWASKPRSACQGPPG